MIKYKSSYGIKMYTPQTQTTPSSRQKTWDLHNYRVNAISAVLGRMVKRIYFILLLLQLIYFEKNEYELCNLDDTYCIRDFKKD